MEKKKMFTLFIAIVLIISGALLLGGDEKEEGKATLDDILSITSERENDPGTVLAPYDEAAYMLVATPIAVQYNGGEKTSVPLLAVGHNNETQETGVSKSVKTFLSLYAPQNVAAIGLEPDMVTETGAATSWQSNEGITKDSLEAAKEFWKSTDAVMIMPDTPEGYEIGVNAACIASYLNIPIIVADGIDSSTETTLENLGVKYSIVCGDAEGYGKVWRFEETWDVLELLTLGTNEEDARSIMSERLGAEPSYIALGNPMDAYEPVVLESFNETFTGEVISQHTGSTSFPTIDAGSPAHYITIPDNYTYANVILDSRLDFTNSGIPGSNPDLEGQRSYTYFGIDSDKDGNMATDTDTPEDKIHFMCPSLAYDNIRDASGVATQGWGYTEEPIYRSPGEKMVSMVATLHDGGERYENGLAPITSTYTITITVQKLDGPNYPMMHGMSGLASYLAASRGGVALARSDFGIHGREMHLLNDSGDPSQNIQMIDQCNAQVFHVKSVLNELIAQIRGVDSDPLSLAQALKESNETMFLGIIADTNMIPQFIYPSSGQESGQWQGHGVASDNGYADVDLGLEYAPRNLDDEPPSMELAVGRVDGWDAQDCSALLARTFFYNQIIDKFEGHSGQSWKDSAFTSFGTSPPVGTALTVTEKLDVAFRQAGFTVDSYHDGPFSDSKLTAPIYSQSNFIYFCAHGFYYWYVPPGLKPTGVGGGFDTAHVKDMDFGPSVIFASSCVTGKIDGIQPYNALSQSYIHAGFNSYIGASRLSWGGLSIMDDQSGEAVGSYLGLLTYGYMTGYKYDKDGGLQEETGGDLPIGEALMLAKNTFIEHEGSDNGGVNDDTIEEFNLHGDPAFNPYEPNHPAQ